MKVARSYDEQGNELIAVKIEHIIKFGGFSKKSLMEVCQKSEKDVLVSIDKNGEMLGKIDSFNGASFSEGDYIITTQGLCGASLRCSKEFYEKHRGDGLLEALLNR